MGYIRKKHRALLEEIDSRYNYNIPYKWDEFVNNIATLYHNLIIKKAKNQCVCTNCKHEFTSVKKVNDFLKCPNCRKTYLIKRENLKNYNFKNIAVLLDKVDSQFFIRFFEIRSNYDNSCYSFDVSSVEYARKLLFESSTFVNERTSKNTGPIHIYHIPNPGQWRLYTRYYGLSSKGYIYYDNLKQLFKDTQYQYSMIWELAKNVQFFDIEDILRMASHSNCIEMFVKAKLYNLAMDANHFYASGSFEKIFGISKGFYPFMKKYNLTYSQFKILQLLKESNIQKIRYLDNYKFHNLAEINMYIGINQFIKYAKLHHGKVDTYLYKDYLKFANVLGYDLKSNKYAFPKNLKVEHNKLEKQYKIHGRELLNRTISKRYINLVNTTYKDKNFIIFPASTVEELEIESKQQHNCVRTYAEDYANGKCDIFFMRNIKKQDKSLVTVEVKHNKIVQSRIKCNMLPDKKQVAFLNKWEQKVLKVVA